MKVITVLIICLGLFLTISIVEIKSITLKPIFMQLYHWQVSNDTNRSLAAFRIAQTIFDQSVLDTVAKDTCSTYEYCFTKNELNHLRDVDQLIFWIEMYAIITPIIILFEFIWLRNKIERFKTAIKSIVLTATIINLCVLLLFFGFALFGWDSFFTRFHGIFFPQGNWTFAATSSLIKLYPDNFWEVSGLILIGVQAIIYLSGIIFLWLL